ncbi:MAG: succinylglutamate desuccinylase/aspartoacylase family protein [Lachnospiraceae bacterium]|nr:succinylglutamate desuccinylase/aspartoacylase family protein [Lachnospiraceae bacterium]
MKEIVLEYELPVGEKLTIYRNRIMPCSEINSPGRISIVSGTHGDELEGQYICYELARRIALEPENLMGIVDIYPAINPFGIDMASKNSPLFNRDLNRSFPGSSSGDLIDRVTSGVVESVLGSDLCLDIHASDIFVREIPQVRLSEDFADNLLPFAKLTNADMIWMNATATVHESTLAHSLNILGVPTMVIEMGQGHQINKPYGDQIVDGIFNIMCELGMWMGTRPRTQLPAISSDGSVEFIRSEKAGIFIPLTEHNHFVKAGDIIGEIFDPFIGEKLMDVVSEQPGLLFTQRIYPVVSEGDLLARILTGAF